MKFSKCLFIIMLSLLFMAGTTAAEEKAGNLMVEVKTNLGSFTLELYPDKAPLTIENFMNYVDNKFYDGTIFHRVIPTFMIQGGGFTADMMKKATGAPIKNEADNGLSNTQGTIAMARTGEIHSATCQFFINVKDNKALDHKDASAKGYGYTVFGKVIEGMETVEKIKDVKTATKGQYGDVPVKPIVIKSIRRAEKEE